MVLTKELVDVLKNGNIAAIQEWFSTGTRDPDEKDARGFTLLYLAAIGGHIEMMHVILAHGASADVSNNNGWTPLHVTARNGHCAMTVLLLNHGAQVDARDSDDDRWTPLMLAAAKGYCDLIRLLLHHGADINAREDDGTNAESLARIINQAESTALLADVRRAGGWRPYVRYPRFRLLMLRIVAEQGRAETQDALLRHLFPAEPPAPEGTKRPREAYRAQKGGRLPRGIFMHIVGYWRSSRDYPGPAPDDT